MLDALAESFSPLLSPRICIFCLAIPQTFSSNIACKNRSGRRKEGVMPARRWNSRHVAKQDVLMTAKLQRKIYASEFPQHLQRFKSIKDILISVTVAGENKLFNLYRHRFNSIPGERFVCHHFAYLLLNLQRDVSAWVLFHFFFLTSSPAIISNYVDDLCELHSSSPRKRQKLQIFFLKIFLNPLETFMMFVCLLINLGANRLWLLKNIS